jgi:hypothetical protein
MNATFSSARTASLDWCESGLSQVRVAQIIEKYLNVGVVVRSPTKEDHYGYWVRVAPHLDSLTGR